VAANAAVDLLVSNVREQLITNFFASKINTTVVEHKIRRSFAYSKQLQRLSLCCRPYNRVFRCESPGDTSLDTVCHAFSNYRELLRAVYRRT